MRIDIGMKQITLQYIPIKSEACRIQSDLMLILNFGFVQLLLLILNGLYFM